MKNLKPVTYSFMILMLLTTCAFAADPVSPSDFLGQVLDAISKMGGLSWLLKVSSVVGLVIASMKVSVLNDLIWKKLGALQAWVAPVLGLVAGLLSLASGGGITLPRLFAWLAAGAGAVVLHELLDSVKAIPGLGSVYVGLIDSIEKILGGPAAKAQ